jgi:hypothetical protein
VSLAFGQACAKAGIARSMGSRGDCWDNAVAESFFATLKKELIRRQSWPTRAELRTAVFDYIEIFYNATRGTRRSGCSRQQTTRTALSAATGRNSPLRDSPQSIRIQRRPKRPNPECPPNRGKSMRHPEARSAN